MDDHRIAATDVTSRLATHGAVLIEGATAVGTTTARPLCNSHVRLDHALSVDLRHTLVYADVANDHRLVAHVGRALTTR